MSIDMIWYLLTYAPLAFLAFGNLYFHCEEAGVTLEIGSIKGKVDSLFVYQFPSRKPIIDFHYN